MGPELQGRYDEPAPRPAGIGPGTVLEWQRCPVAVLSDLWWIDGDGWVARATYVRTEPHKFQGFGDRFAVATIDSVRRWQVLPRFRVENKPTWPFGISDEEEARIMMMILTDRG